MSRVVMIYNDHELRDVLSRYAPGSALEPPVAAMLVATVRFVLEQRDDARARCVELLGRPTALDARRKGLLNTVHDSLQAALSEPHDPATGRVIDAVLALHAYLADTGAVGHGCEAAP
jgi:hypothetical protein